MTQRKRGEVGKVVARRQGKTLVLRDTFLPNQKQWEFFKAAAMPGVDEILFDGSIRGGKSQAACKLIVAWAMRYGGTYAVMRYTQQELNDSTKKIMLHGDGIMAPVLPPELIAWKNETFNMVKLINGSEILFRSMEPKERGKIRNLTLAGCFIDQAEEMDDEGIEDYYDEILGRLSDPNAPRKMILVANPGPETHWLVPRFGLTEETEHLRPKSRKRIHVSILDNEVNLEAAYVRRLMATEETRPDYFKRMVMGQWGVVAGRRFKCFDPRMNIVDELPFSIVPDDWYWYEGMDWGNTNPTCVLWVAADYQGALWVLAEHYEAEQPVSYHARKMFDVRANLDGWLGFQGQPEPTASWLDPSAWNQQRKEISSVADTFNDQGIYAARAQNDRIGGWTLIEEMLTEIMPDGYSRLRLWRPGCPNLIREIANLRVKPGTEDCEKVHDHAPDALRYVVMSRSPTPTEKRNEDEAMTRESLLRRIVDQRDAHARGDHIVVPS